MATSNANAPHWGWLALLGTISLIGGVMGFFNPMAASFTALVFAAWIFLIYGVIHLVQTFRASGRGAGFIWNLIISLLMIALAISLIFRPLEGLVSLTVLAAVFFIAIGAAKIFYSFDLRPVTGWGWVLVSGIVSLALGVMIFMDLPWAALAVLGILLSVELLSNGIFLLLMAFGLRGLTKA